MSANDWKDQVYKVFYKVAESPLQLDAWLHKMYFDEGLTLISANGDYYIFKPTAVASTDLRIAKLKVALRGLMQFHPEDELGPTTEEFWTPEYKAAMDAARAALKGGEE